MLLIFLPFGFLRSVLLVATLCKSDQRSSGCSGERSSESAAIPFGGIAQTSNVSVPFGMGTA